MVDSLKISRFEVINDIIKEAPWSNEKSIKPEELGLPFVGDISTLEELEKLLSERIM